MNLSMKFLYLQLKNHYKNLRLILPRDKNPLCANIRMVPHTFWTPFEDTLYLTELSIREVNKSFFPPASRFILLDDDIIETVMYPSLVFPADVDKSMIFDDILSIFYRYDNWSKNVTEAILKRKSLQEILEITREVEDNPMYFADKSFKMLANISKDMGEFSVIWRYQLEYGYLPFNVMMDLAETGEIDMLNNAKKAIYAVTKSFTTHFVSKSIYWKKKVQGYFFIVECYRQLTQCDIEIAEHMGDLISVASQDGRNYLQTSSLYHEHFMIDILEETLTDEQLIKDQLKSLGWEIYGEYRMLGLVMDGDSDALKRNALVMLCYGWNAHAFLYKEMLIIIYNESPGKYHKLQSHICQNLKNLHRRGGLSEIFSDFCQMSRYYKQVRTVLEESGGEDEMLFLYENYYMAHRNRLIQNIIPLYQPAEKLMTYDKVHKCQYCQTLYCYLLQERNAVHTAKILFLHRNTLKYRLEKIEQILQVPLDVPMVRQRLFDSLFRILYSGTGNENGAGETEI